MSVEALAESASVKRGSDAVADNEERARLRLRAEGKRARNMVYKAHWNPRARRRPGWSRGGVRSVKAHNLSQNWRKRSRQKKLKVPVGSSVAASVSVQDMVQTDVPIPTCVLESNRPALVQLDRLGKARDFEKLTNLVLTTNEFPRIPSRESVQGPVKTCLEMRAVDPTEVYSPSTFNERSMQLGLRKGVAAELETGWNLGTKSLRDKRSSELRTAKPQILIANPPCPWSLKLLE